MIAPQDILLWGLAGAFWDGLLAAAIGVVYRKLRERHRINTAELVRQIEEASAAEQEVWPPPPTNPMVKNREQNYDNHA